MSKENNETMKTKQEIILPESGNNETDQKLIDNFLSHSDEEYRQMGKEIEEAEKKREEKDREKKEREEKERKEKEKNERIERLRGKTYAILEDLKENHVKVEKDAEMMGYKGKKVHIELPAIGNFKGFKFDYFVSDDRILKSDFEKRTVFAKESELEKKSYSMKDISNLLQAMNSYMIELHGEKDRNVNYENCLETWRPGNYYNCYAGDCLKKITGLGNCYWLSDKDVAGKKDSRVGLYCFYDNCHFSCFKKEHNNSSALYLLLRL